MAFRKKIKKVSTYDDPEALFRDRRNRTVQGPLSHQSDILRRYHKEAFNLPNVALELPTGSGKTLVGLLIAEFRRVTKQERVLYLCPTKQLALQVCEQSHRKYGIEATPFIGRIKNYNQNDKVKYQTAKTIAVAPYSALFNINPFFNTPQFIILDDAHASENYIAANWSLEIFRSQNNPTYIGLLNIIKDSLPKSQQQRFLSDDLDDCGIKWIEKVPTNDLINLSHDIIPFLDANTEETNLYYPWQLIRDHLEACHIYVSYDQILIRPYIPPSLTHEPFANATQRVFMSATLGLGGDLERITGISSFHRLPIPEGWDKQGIGRRYFIFPEMSLQKDCIPELLKKMVGQAGRAVIIVPSSHNTYKFNELFDDIPIYTAKDIESSKDAFVSNDNAVAVLANRYDGIDFLDDQCRLLIIEGLPKAGNLQELYLMSRMVAGNLFKDRIRTRIIQALGRCTRSATDYAAIVVIGEDFFDWLVLKENRSLFHPELQGELIFGAEQADMMTEDNYLENLNIFLEHGPEWDDVDADIIENRDETVQSSIPGQDILYEAAKKEVEYIYSIWNNDYEKSLCFAQEVANSLSGESLKGLRGFWYYLAGSACELASKQLNDNTYYQKAYDLYGRASNCLPAISQLRILASRKNNSEELVSIEDNVLLISNVERIEMLFDRKSFALPIKFEKVVKNIIDGINSKDSNSFEEGHRLLGEMLGFKAENSKGDATPDPWWISGDSLCIVFEDKSDSKPEHSVPVKHTRQAASHRKWIEDNVELNEKSKIFTVMITTQSKIHKDVPTFADDVGWWHIKDFREWALTAIAVLRKIRSTYTGPGQEEWRNKVANELLKNKLDPISIVNKATKILLKNVTIE